MGEAKLSPQQVDRDQLILYTLEYHEKYESYGPEIANQGWRIIQEDFVRVRRYSPQEFEYMSWEVDEFLGSLDQDLETVESTVQFSGQATPRQREAKTEDITWHDLLTEVGYWAAIAKKNIHRRFGNRYDLSKVPGADAPQDYLDGWFAAKRAAVEAADPDEAWANKMVGVAMVATLAGGLLVAKTLKKFKKG